MNAYIENRVYLNFKDADEIGRLENLFQRKMYKSPIEPETIVHVQNLINDELKMSVAINMQLCNSLLIAIVFQKLCDL